jgi:hypothetical protein
MDPVFSIEDAIVKIRVYGKPNGAYRFKEESATGKSWLCKLLKMYQARGEKVAGYTYSDYTFGLDIGSLLNKGYKLVMIDRYDMYNGKMANEIAKLSDECIVLIDCKTFPNISRICPYKNIEMTQNCITIR